jgi:acyl-coenzyme A synthetase/AMP-(fatty) acid ligase
MKKLLFLLPEEPMMLLAGHRLSTAEMEEVVAAHPCVATECAVIKRHSR